MSSAISSMMLGVKALKAGDRVTVIDSANLSTGVGLLVIEAAIMAKEGKSSKEIAQRIEELKPRVRASFVVDTLTYLHRGGRCSGVAALVGGVLKLHPQINVTDGKMAPDKKFRGKMNRVIMNYAKELEPSLLKAKPDRVFITHSGCEQSILDEVKAYLESLNHFEEILITRAGGVISSHCGPGTLGVLFIDGE
jgi:DegV family protein with EDD domain